MARIFRTLGGQRGQHVTKLSVSLQILTPKECELLLDDVTEDPFRTMLVAALSLGLRKSELLALRWGDFDRDGCQLGIRQRKVNVYPARQLPRAAATAFRNWRSKTKFSADTDFVFADPRRNGETHYDAHSLWHRHFRPAGIRAGIYMPFHWHTLRSTSVVMWCSLSMDAFTTSTLLLRSMRTTLKCVGTVSPADLMHFRHLAQTLFFGLDWHNKTRR